jgi:DNA-binding NtrC family response regulator
MSRVNSESRPIRILLVEDDLDDAELVRAHFAEAGMHVELERVESRPTFRAALSRGEVDLVLADYSLPRFDGPGVLELAGEMRPDIPVVLISGVIDEDLAIESLKLGATDYVLKQRLERLVPVVVRALRDATARRGALLEVRAATREVRDCATTLTAELRSGVSLSSLANLGVAIDQLEALLAKALGERS